MEGDVCEVCAGTGQHGRLKLFQINLDEAVLVCENEKCTYPIGAKTTSGLITHRKATDIANTRRKKGRPVGVTIQRAAAKFSTGQRTRSLKGFPNSNSLPLKNISRSAESSPITKQLYELGSKIPKQQTPLCKASNISRQFQFTNVTKDRQSKSCTPIRKAKAVDIAYPKPVKCEQNAMVLNQNSTNTGVFELSKLNGSDACPSCLPTISQEVSNKGRDNPHACAKQNTKNTIPAAHNDSYQSLTLTHHDSSAFTPYTDIGDILTIPVSTDSCHVKDSLKPVAVVNCDNEPMTKIKTKSSNLDGSKSPLSQVVKPGSFLQWKNVDALCWLDVILCVFVHNKTLGTFVSDNVSKTESLIYKLFSAYNSAMKIITGNSSGVVKCRASDPDDLFPVKTGGGHSEKESVFSINCDTECVVQPTELTDNLNKATETLNAIREEVWQSLQSRLQCVKGRNDTPVFALPLLVKETPALHDLFRVDYRWHLVCKQCGYQQEDKHSKTLPTFPTTSQEFRMTDPHFLRPCFRCGAANQKRTMVFERLPEILMLHFVEGLPRGNVTDYNFVFGAVQYCVTAVVQYKTQPDHFVSWVRGLNGKFWMECDDMKSHLCQYVKGEPKISPNEVHILVWEKQQTAMKTDNSTQAKQDCAIAQTLTSNATQSITPKSVAVITAKTRPETNHYSTCNTERTISNTANEEMPTKKSNGFDTVGELKPSTPGSQCSSPASTISDEINMINSQTSSHTSGSSLKQGLNANPSLPQYSSLSLDRRNSQSSLTSLCKSTSSSPLQLKTNLSKSLNGNSSHYNSCSSSSNSPSSMLSQSGGMYRNLIQHIVKRKLSSQTLQTPVSYNMPKLVRQSTNVFEGYKPKGKVTETENKTENVEIKNEVAVQQEIKPGTKCVQFKERISPEMNENKMTVNNQKTEIHSVLKSPKKKKTPPKLTHRKRHLSHEMGSENSPVCKKLKLVLPELNALTENNQSVDNACVGNENINPVGIDKSDTIGNLYKSLNIPQETRAVIPSNDVQDDFFDEFFGDSQSSSSISNEYGLHSHIHTPCDFELTGNTESSQDVSCLLENLAAGGLPVDGTAEMSELDTTQFVGQSNYAQFQPVVDCKNEFVIPQTDISSKQINGNTISLSTIGSNSLSSMRSSSSEGNKSSDTSRIIDANIQDVDLDMDSSVFANIDQLLEDTF